MSHFVGNLFDLFSYENEKNLFISKNMRVLYVQVYLKKFCKTFFKFRKTFVAKCVLPVPDLKWSKKQTLGCNATTVLFLWIINQFEEQRQVLKVGAIFE